MQSTILSDREKHSAQVVDEIDRDLLEQERLYYIERYVLSRFALKAWTLAHLG